MHSSRELTVADAVAEVAADRLLLPGIQRSFVWKPRQIEALFDSLMREYPIGPMLLWRTSPADRKQLRFIRLVTEYQGKGSVPSTAHPKATGQLQAVLDGQQRLTALNIGLRGTYAASEHGTRKRLYLDLDTDLPDAGSEVNRYRFEFRANGDGGEGTWFPVGDAWGLKDDETNLNHAIIAVGHPPIWRAGRSSGRWQGLSTYAA